MILLQNHCSDINKITLKKIVPCDIRATGMSPHEENKFQEPQKRKSDERVTICLFDLTQTTLG